MAARQTLNMRQAPALVMTQQLHLAFKLLTFSNAELVEYVERELESNPLLERDEREFAPVAAEGEDGAGQEIRGQRQGNGDHHEGQRPEPRRDFQQCFDQGPLPGSSPVPPAIFGGSGGKSSTMTAAEARDSPSSA